MFTTPVGKLCFESNALVVDCHDDEPAERSDFAPARWRRKLVVLFRRRHLMPFVEAQP
jgi:hypothetical protein